MCAPRILFLVELMLGFKPRNTALLCVPLGHKGVGGSIECGRGAGGAGPGFGAGAGAGAEAGAVSVSGSTSCSGHHGTNQTHKTKIINVLNIQKNR